MKIKGGCNFYVDKSTLVYENLFELHSKSEFLERLLPEKFLATSVDMLGSKVNYSLKAMVR